jgi:hypothetical protein
MEQSRWVALNFAQCEQVAAVLQTMKLNPGFYARDYLTVDAGRETLLSMHFQAVAICHQTHSLHHPGRDLWGWDYIEYVFTGLAKQQSRLLDPAFLATQEITEITHLLAEAFSHTGNAADTTLDRLEERAHLMKEAAEYLVKNYNGKMVDFFAGYHQQLENGNNGLYRRLSNMEAFSDKWHKKSTFLIKLLTESGLIAITDPENLIPIMDYHMQRVLLRLGCVEITDDTLRQKIMARQTLTTDEPVRSFCVEAFRLIAEMSGYEVTKMNDFFWSLGRSCCHQTTLCKDHFCEKTPCTFAQIVHLGDHSSCAFQNVCKGAEDESYRRLWQPVVETHYY